MKKKINKNEKFYIVRKELKKVFKECFLIDKDINVLDRNVRYVKNTKIKKMSDNSQVGKMSDKNTINI